jgi:UDP-3-O-[3-hydroxymyristoyl] glucosamine N-acyltransferase
VAGHGCKVRVHEGRLDIGAKSVLGQECTISAFQHISIGRECIIADRVMLIDFDHGASEHERPIRDQGIYKRDVDLGTTLGRLRRVLPARGDRRRQRHRRRAHRRHEGRARQRGGRRRPARVLRMRPTPRRLRWR